MDRFDGDREVFHPGSMKLARKDKRFREGSLILVSALAEGCGSGTHSGNPQRSL